MGLSSLPVSCLVALRQLSPGVYKLYDRAHGDLQEDLGQHTSPRTADASASISRLLLTHASAGDPQRVRQNLATEQEQSENVSCSVTSDSATPWTMQPARLLCAWDSPGKNTGVGCHSLLQGIFPTRGSNLGFLHYRQILYCLNHKGSPKYVVILPSGHRKLIPGIRAQQHGIQEPGSQWGWSQAGGLGTGGRARQGPHGVHTARPRGIITFYSRKL